MASGVVSFLLKENLEGEWSKEGRLSRVCVNSEIPFKYIPTKLDLIEYSNYNFFNFPNKFILPDKFFSHKDFFKFKKIKIKNKYLFLEETIFPTEPGFFGIIEKQYAFFELKNFLFDCINKSSKKIAKTILSGSEVEGDFSLIKQMASAFGWGLAKLVKEENNLNLYLKYSFFTRYGVDFIAYVFKGFLEFIFKKKIKLVSVSENYSSFFVEFKYQFS